MNAARDEAGQLFRAAIRDRTLFELLLGTPRAPHEIAPGFLAQQACEKFINAVLVVHRAQVGRAHDLERLFDLATSNEAPFLFRANCYASSTHTPSRFDMKAGTRSG